MMPDTSGLRALVLATINATARVQPAQCGENPSFDAIIAPDVLTGYRRAGRGGEDGLFGATISAQFLCSDSSMRRRPCNEDSPQRKRERRNAEPGA
jgi:hypothetical protein